MAQEKKIRVLEGVHPGNAEDSGSIFFNLINYLNKDEFEPVVLSFSDGAVVDQLKEAGIRICEIHSDKPFDKNTSEKVIQWILDKKIDLVHAHGSHAAGNLFQVAGKNKLPFVYTSGGWAFQYDKKFFKRRNKKNKEKSLIRAADVNICTSQSEAETGKKLFRDYNPEIIMNAVDTERFNYKISGESVRKELEIAAGEIVISFLARFTHQNQPLTLLRAFEKVSESLPGIRLLMAGEGEEKDEVAHLIGDKGSDKKIILLPRRKDVPKILAATDIFVYPSLRESSQMGLLEAMAMKKAIIASDVKGAEEIIRPGITGMLIDTDSLEKNLADAISLLVRNKTLREDLAEGALYSVSRQPDVISMAREYEKIYRRLVKGKE